MNMYTFKAASMPGSVMTTLSRNSEVEGKLLVSPDWESELTYYYKDISDDHLVQELWGRGEAVGLPWLRVRAHLSL